MIDSHAGKSETHSRGRDLDTCMENSNEIEFIFSTFQTLNKMRSWEH